MQKLDERSLEELLDVGIALSSTHDLNRLLSMILAEARRITAADAGTLYLSDGETLRAEVGQCRTFIERWGEARACGIFRAFTVPVDMESVAGAAAYRKEVVNIPDVQDVDSRCPFKYNPEYDRANEYSTHSNLAVPMLGPDGGVIGVLQLINAMHGSRIVPFDAVRVKLARALASQAAVSIRNAMLTSSLRGAHLDTLKRLGIAAEWRDKETANHITRVSQYCRVIAETLGWTAEMCELVTLSSPMHDVGKLGVPDAILHKPGKLDPGERKIMETHAVIGANIMANADNEVMQWSRIVALGHHEKWDGSGYPFGLSGDEIHPVCRIVALADVFDALSSRRVYKPPFPHEKVMEIIDADTGKHFDPGTVSAFKKSLDRIAAIRDKYVDTEADFEKFRNYDGIKLIDG